MSVSAASANPMVPSVTPWIAPSVQVAPGAMPSDTFKPSGIVPSAAPTKPVGVMSFFSNIWDQFLGPIANKVAAFFMGLFGK